MKQVHLKLLLCLLLATTVTGQLNTAGQFGQNFGGQQFGLGQSSMSGWGGLSGMGSFQPGAQSQFNAGLSQLGQQPGSASSLGGGLGQFGGASQFGGGFGQGGAGSSFGGGFGQGGAGSSFGGGFGQGGMGSSLGGGFGQGGMGSSLGGGFGQGGMGSSLGGGFGQGGIGSSFGGGFGQGGVGSQFGGGFGQGGAASQFGGGLSQFGQQSGAGFGQGGAASQFGGGLSQFGQQSGAGFGQGGAASQFGGGLSQFGQQSGAGFGQAAVAQQAAQPVAQQVAQPVTQQADQTVASSSSYGGGYGQASGGTRTTGADLTSGTTQQYSSSVAVPAAGDTRSVSSNSCFNVIDSAFPTFTDYCSVLPQTTFSLPNFFGHQSKQQASDLLVALTPALTSHCFKHIRMFICPLFFPPCEGEPILPCASLCRAVQSRCGGFDLSAINCDQLPENSEFCPSITTISRSFVPPVGPSRTLPSFDQQGSYSNDYSGGSVLNRASSSYGGASNDLIQPPATGGAYGGAGDLSAGSNRAIFNTAQFSQVPNVAPIVNVPSQSSNINTVNQGWTIADSSTTGGFSRSAPVLMRSGNTGYGSDSVSLLKDNSLDGGSYGGSASSKLVNSVGPTGYGNNNGNSLGLSFGNTIKSLDSTSFADNSNYGGGSSARIVGPTSYGNNNGNSLGLSIGNTIKSLDSTSFGDNSNYGGGSSARIVGPTSYGNNNGNSLGLSIGNTIKSVGSSYGNNAKSVGSFSIQPTGPPYGIQSTGNLNTYFQDQLDVSKCGNPPAQSPCTAYGPQFYPLPGSPQCYIQCVFDTFAIKPCPSFLVWNSQINVCDWPATADNSATDNTLGLSSLGARSNNYGPSTFSISKSNSGGGSSYSYGRKKRSTTERKKRYSQGGGYDSQGGGYGGSGGGYGGSGGGYGGSGGGFGGPGGGFGGPGGGFGGPFGGGFDGGFGGPFGGFDGGFGGPFGGFDGGFGGPLGGFGGPLGGFGGPFGGFGGPLGGFGGPLGGLGGPFGGLGGPFGGLGGLGGGFGGPPIVSEVPLGPPVPGLLPLPGFLGPIGVPGPLIPPPFFPPLLPPLIPPFLPPIAPIPPPFFPPPLLPPFLPPLIPPLPIPLPGPLLPPLPMSLPATFIPGPPPLFGAPFLPPFGGPFGGPFGPLGGPLGGPIGEPFGPFGGPLGGIGGPLGGIGGPFGGIGGPFGGIGGPFGGIGGPFGGIGGPFGGIGGPFGGIGGPFGGPFGGEPFFDDPFGPGFGFGGGFPFGDNFGGLLGGFDSFGGSGGKGNKKGGNGNNYGKSYSSYGDDDDYGYSGGSSYKKNGNFKDSYKSKNYNNDYSNNNNNYDDDYSSNYRKKRQYGLNVDQDTSFPTMNQQQVLPKVFQSGYNPVQKLSYGSMNQLPRLLATNSFQQQSQFPTQQISQPLVQSSPCIGKSSKSNVPHPTDPRKYISCLNEEKYEIMDCPTSLIYNPVVDQCEKVKNTESVCEREQPCLNDGQCYQTSPSTYKCTCRGSWTGEHCETPLSTCASNPCGEGNECHTLIASDYKQDYVCVCDGRQSYGLTCGRNTVPNPCLAASSDNEQYYPFAFSAHAYVQCNGDILYVRPCSAGLYWNQDTKICDREETSPARPAEDQPQSYQVKYNTQSYNRPMVSLADQNVDKQQGYRYRNYNPHVVSNDQSSTYNQINSRQETPIINSYSSPSLTMKPNRLFQDQQQFTPVLTQQQPVITNQQYGQSFIQQSQPPVFQGTPQRPMFRFFQSTPSRSINNLNTQSTSSSYRR